MRSPERMRALLLLVVPTSAAAGYAHDPSLPLHPAEYEALLEFKAAIFKDDGLLKTWVPDANGTVDPCNSWEGVDCNCEKLYPLPVEPHPCPDNEDSLFEGDGYNHVYRLDFGPRKSSNKRLHGVYSPYLGNLTEVRQFYLHVNKFEGTIPTEFGKLQKIQRMIIRDNVLTGSIPPELGNAVGIKDLYFDNNNIAGSIPDSLCNIVTTPDSVLNVVQPSNNPFLCDEVPTCLYGKYLNPLHVVGTHLIYPPADDPSSTRVAGYCSTELPKCDGGEDCYVDVPAVIPSLQEFEFGFTNFTDPIGMRSYSWCIGTKPNICDAHSLTTYDASRQEETQQRSRGLRQPAPNRVTYTARGVSLMNGGKYYVTVVGENMAGPPLKSNITSSMILVDNTPPLPNKIKWVELSMDCSESSTGDQYDKTQVSLCWEAFSEPESSVDSYKVGLEDRDGNAVVELIDVGNTTSITIENLDLVAGTDYVGIVQAVNTAGLSGSGRSLSLRILAPPEENSNSNVAWIIVIAVLVPMIIVITAVAYKARQRLLDRIRLEKWHADNAQQLEELRNVKDARRPSMASTVSLDEDEVFEQEEAIMFGNESASIYFVFTDIEGSTAISQTNPAAHKVIQQVHDGILRQCLSDNNGYEINTQGDAFEVVFVSASSAAMFCLAVQKQLLNMKWSKDVLKIHACRRETNLGGTTEFAGPRVRMGIHKAHKEGITRKIHDLTKHVVFGGPDFLLGQAIGDAAYGGQIVCSKNAAFDIVKGRTSNDAPNVKYLGDYSQICRQENIPIYQLMPAWGSSAPRRTFPLELYEGERLKSSELPTFRIMPRPVTEDGRLATIVIRISGYTTLKQSSTAVDLAGEIIASLAQNYGGYIETLSPLDENVRLVTFKDTSLALQFSMMLHASFMFAPWEHHISTFDRISAFNSQYDERGTLIWRGPKVAMVIDKCDASLLEGNDHPSIADAGLALPIDLIKYLNAGQSVLTDEAWQSLQKRPMRCTFLSLGKMQFRGIQRPITLIQAMPTFLQSRTFSVFACERYISPGYSQAPNPSEGVAIVFCAPKGLSDDDDDNGLSSNGRHAILQKWCSLCRMELGKFHGYECKEVDGGKFLCAFQTYPHAIAFAASVQASLRKSSEVTSKPYLPVAIGAAFGLQLFRKPQRASGRADYFGVIPNLAARVTSQAKPGQSLICVVSEEGVMDFAVQSGDGDGGAKFKYSDDEIIHLKNVGTVKLKGFDFTPMLAQCTLEGTEPEDFGQPKDWISNQIISYRPKRKSGDVSCMGASPGAFSVVRRSSAASDRTSDSFPKGGEIDGKKATGTASSITSRRYSE